MSTDTNIPPYQQRVLDERAQLAERLDKLEKFTQGPLYENLNDIDKNLLIKQGMAMSNYLQVLDQRIERFNAAKAKEDGQASSKAQIHNVGPWLFFGEALIFGGEIKRFEADQAHGLITITTRQTQLGLSVLYEEVEACKQAIDLAMQAAATMNPVVDYSIRVSYSGSSKKYETATIQP